VASGSGKAKPAASGSGEAKPAAVRSFEAGPRTNGGWGVRAQLPFRAETARVGLAVALPGVTAG